MDKMENMHGSGEDHRTPQKFLSNLPLDIREAVRSKGQPQGSPFYCLPNHTTPPSRYLKIKNPFEAALNERLHAHIFSPSVFAKVESRKSIDKFKWTIEDVSSLRPAHIDESTIAQFEQTNPEDEVIAQQKIERFFSETHIVPSPWNEEVKTVPLISESSPVSSEIKDVCESWSQTELSLPPTLPPELELALKPFFSFTQSQKRDTVDVNSSLYKKLFNFDDDSVVSLPSSSVHEELSDATDSLILSCADEQQRNFESSDGEHMSPQQISPIVNSTPKMLNDCEISPILRKADSEMRNELENSFEAQPLVCTSRQSETKLSSRFNFSSHMSVDLSLNMVPENEMLHHNESINSESPLRSTDFMDTSFDWDIEYNNVCFDSKTTRRTLFEHIETRAEAMMDISNSITPKLKTKSSQRKNLSNSFKANESEEDELAANDRSKFRKVNLFDEKHKPCHDTGYDTIGDTHDSTDCSKNYALENLGSFVASTPTKKYFVEN